MYPNFRAIRLQVKTRWQRPNTIPGSVLANVLRGAIGITMRKLVCPEQWHDNPCHSCPMYRECAYGRFFSPSPPGDSEQLRLQQDLPRPFVIEPPGLHPDDRVTSDGLTFRLMLFGTSIELLPYLISALDRLGADGMGRDRVPFSLEQITSCHPAGDEVLYGENSHRVLLPNHVITTQDLLTTTWPLESSVAASNSDARRRVLAKMGLQQDVAPSGAVPGGPVISIKFLTPLLLKSGSGIDQQGRRIAAQEIRERPPFGVIIRRLRDRLSSLCTFFGERWECADFARLGVLADQVTIRNSQTTWLTRSRSSSRTGHAHEISGLVGKTTYAFPDQSTYETLSPLLKIGELIHVGKNAPWGNGGIRVLSAGGS